MLHVCCTERVARWDADEASEPSDGCPSKRYQASYARPDLQRHTAPITFSSAADAETWLVDERRLIESGAWTPPSRRAAAVAEPEPEPLTLERFAKLWLDDLELRPATRRDYDSLLKDHISPPLGAVLVSDVTKATVRAWWNGLDASKHRARSKAFQLLHNIMAGAVELEVIDTNSVALPRRTRIRSKRAKKIEPLTVSQLNRLARSPSARGTLPAIRAADGAKLDRHRHRPGATEQTPSRTGFDLPTLDRALVGVGRGMRGTSVPFAAGA